MGAGVVARTVRDACAANSSYRASNAPFSLTLCENVSMAVGCRRQPAITLSIQLHRSLPAKLHLHPQQLLLPELHLHVGCMVPHKRSISGLRAAAPMCASVCSSAWWGAVATVGACVSCVRTRVSNGGSQSSSKFHSRATPDALPMGFEPQLAFVFGGQALRWSANAF